MTFSAIGVELSGRWRAELPSAYASQIERVRLAVADGDFALAVTLADELQQRAAAESGALHPDALNAQELRAHVSFCCGDFATAADIYSASAIAWAAQGLGGETVAARNAEHCRWRAEAAGAVPGSPLARSVGGRWWYGGSLPAGSVRSARRGGGALVLACAGILAGFAFGSSPPGAELRAGSISGVAASAGPVAPVLVEALDRIPEPSAPPVADVAGPTAAATQAPEPRSEPVAVEGEEAEPASGSVSPSRKPGRAGTSTLARPRDQRPAGVGPSAGPALGQDFGAPRFSKELSAVCAAGREHGRLPEVVEQMCRRVPGR
ncbi:hypothetical protein ACGFX4_20025 [Kitasatospora sp. NPDC048365]|uniref:hypothetical protein n=1 Tax=Kitasatospora sp. NPDC048365 TaxID=3364050 RepID=UPI00371F0146